MVGVPDNVPMNMRRVPKLIHEAYTSQYGDAMELGGPVAARRCYN